MRQQAAIRKFTFDLDLDDRDAVRRSYEQPAHTTVQDFEPESAALAPKPEPEPEPQVPQTPLDVAVAQAEADAAAAEAEALAAQMQPPEPETPPEPTFSLQDVEAARDEAYVAGHTAALQEAEAATERLASESLHFIAQGLRQLGATMNEPYKRLEPMAVEVAVAICRRVLPMVTLQYGTAEIEGLIRSILPTIIEQPRIVVRVHPALSGMVRDGVQPVIADTGFEGRLLVVDDAAIQPGDARLEWADGGIERDTPRTWGEILQVIDRNVLAASGITGDFGEAEAAADAERSRLLAEHEARVQAAATAEAMAAAAPDGSPRANLGDDAPRAGTAG
ncbi:FliH/SctL family protein [Caenispirillum bisanense]|nr:FliH/SctL family protein [Caenispirillum bisanense]